MASGTLGLDITLSLSVLFPALAMLVRTGPTDIFPTFCFAALIAVLASAGAAHRGAFWPTILAAIGAVIRRPCRDEHDHAGADGTQRRRRD